MRFKAMRSLWLQIRRRFTAQTTQGRDQLTGLYNNNMIFSILKLKQCLGGYFHYYSQSSKALQVLLGPDDSLLLCSLLKKVLIVQNETFLNPE